MPKLPNSRSIAWLGLIFIVACATTSTIKLTEQDQGRAVKLVQGQQLRISLDANPTSGFRWYEPVVTDGVLKRMGEPQFVRDDPNDEHITGRGKLTWLFQAARPGQQTVRLEYGRPFERDLKPVRVVSFDVQVE
jgi:inhibitor of cysteine peptidase